MADWIHRPSTEEFTYQPGQYRFMVDRRIRVCKNCTDGEGHGKEYYAIYPELICPSCGEVGKRKFNYMLLRASRRFGKTAVCSMAATDEAQIPNSYGWACAPNVPKLVEYVIPAFQRIIPAEMVRAYDKQFGNLHLINGATIHFQSLDEPDMARGQGLDWVWIDEVCLLTKRHWEVMEPSMAGDTITLLGTTPRGFDWVNDEFYKRAERGEPGFWAYHGKAEHSANPRLTSEFLAEQKRKMDPDWYEQEYNASLVVFQGAIYGGKLITAQTLLEDSPKLKELIPEWPNIASWRQLFIGIDTGADHPFGATKMVVTEQGLVIVDEYLERSRAFIDHVSDLKAMRGPNPVRWCINKNEKQPMLELHRLGITCQPADNEQLGGTQRVQTWLRQGKLWFVGSRVPHTVSQMMSLRHAEGRKDEQSRKKLVVYKKDDELPDTIRYSIACMPELADDPEHAKQADISMYENKVQGEIVQMRDHLKARDTRRQNVVTGFFE